MTNIDARAIHQAVCTIDGCDAPLQSDQRRAEHLAPLIAAAVDAARAEAWEEGYDAGFDDAGFDQRGIHVNPYRKATP